MKKLIRLLLLTVPFALLPSMALADVPSLQVAPLSYTGNLKPGAIASGFVDVSNPSDQNVAIAANVKAFKQVDKLGDLAFSNDPAYANAITVGLPNFELGPRQAIRVTFSIDPAELPQGGVYAAIFFRTQPTAQNSNSTYVLQSANVGTLLILTNGGAGSYHGSISNMSIPFWQSGGGLSGSIDFTNTDTSSAAVAFKPSLDTHITPWGAQSSMASGLLLPGVTRQFSFGRPGSFFGLLPITFTDSKTGVHATAWVFAITGAYEVVAPLSLVILVLLVIAFIQWRRSPRKPAPVKLPTLDGLTRRPQVTPAPAEPNNLPVEYSSEESEAAAGAQSEAADPLESEDQPEDIADALAAEVTDDRETYGLNVEPQAPEPQPETPESKPIVKVKLTAKAPAPVADPKPRPKRKRKRKPLDDPRG